LEDEEEEEDDDNDNYFDKEFAQSMPAHFTMNSQGKPFRTQQNMMT
jgi:hypothetical protein